MEEPCGTGEPPSALFMPWTRRSRVSLLIFTELSPPRRTVSATGPPPIDVEYLSDANRIVVLLNGTVIHDAERLPVRGIPGAAPAAAPAATHRAFAPQQQAAPPAQYAPAAASGQPARAALRPPAIAVGPPPSAPPPRSPAPSTSPYLQRQTGPSPTSTQRQAAPRAWNSPTPQSPAAAAAAAYPPASPQRSPGSYHNPATAVAASPPPAAAPSSGRSSPSAVAQYQSPYLQSQQRPVSARPAYGRPPESPGGTARSPAAAGGALQQPQSARPASASPPASAYSSQYQYQAPYTPPAAVQAARNLLSQAAQRPASAALSRAASPAPAQQAQSAGRSPAASAAASPRRPGATPSAASSPRPASAAGAAPGESNNAGNAARPAAARPTAFPEHLRPYLPLAYEMGLIGTVTLRRALSPPPAPLRQQEHGPARRAVDDVGVTLSSTTGRSKCAAAAPAHRCSPLLIMPRISSLFHYCSRDS